MAWVLVLQLPKGFIPARPGAKEPPSRPVPSRPFPAGTASPGAARPSRRCVGTTRRGWLWGRGVGLPRVLGFSFFNGETVSEGEKTFLAGQTRRFFSVCGVLFCEFGEQAPAAVPAGEQSSLSWKSASQRKKCRFGWFGFSFFFFPFILFKGKAGEESYYFPEGLIALLRATELQSFVTEDCKAALKVRNTPPKELVAQPLKSGKMLLFQKSSSYLLLM